MAANSHGIVDQSGFFEALESARTGQSGSIEALRRLLTLESWLRYTAQKGIWKGVVATSNHSHSPSTREGNRVVVLR
jgi:hypothetical protein